MSELHLQKQIINCINLALFDRTVFPWEGEVSQEALYAMSKKHNVTALVAEGMKKSKRFASILPAFDELSRKYLFQYAHQTIALEQAVTALEERACPFVLLKGAQMRSFYPEPYLRTSCDIDILTRESDAVIHEIMEGMGCRFTVDADTTINFALPPVVEFEMHRRLFRDDSEFDGFFSDIWSYTLPAGADRVERVLPDEIFYVYMIAHMAKHVDCYGCGIRPLVDIYLFNRKRPQQYDSEKALTILERTGLAAFEERLRSLTEAWFETGELTSQDELLTAFLFGAGLYGNETISSAQKIRKSGSRRKGRFSMLVHHVFPPMWIMRPMYPRLLRCGIFLPVAWVMRGFRLLFCGRKKTTEVLSKMKDLDDSYLDRLSEVMHEFRMKGESAQ